jgi:hypothetical protein
VHFTCTAENFPGRPTTQSKLSESPQGLLTGNPCSLARPINTDSAHSPRIFLSLITFGFRFVIHRPQTEKWHS